MADTESAVIAELRDLKARVTAYTTELGEELAAAHQALANAEAAGRAAQKKEDAEAAEADKQAALTAIKEISAGLIRFSPSGN